MAACIWVLLRSENWEVSLTQNLEPHLYINRSKRPLSEEVAWSRLICTLYYFDIIFPILDLPWKSMELDRWKSSKEPNSYWNAKKNLVNPKKFSSRKWNRKSRVSKNFKTCEEICHIQHTFKNSWFESGICLQKMKWCCENTQYLEQRKIGKHCTRLMLQL